MKLPAFKEAVSALDQNQPQKAIKLFKSLVLEYPDHPLSNVYLGLALGGLTGQLEEDDAQTYFSKGMNLPDGETTIKHWAHNNSAIAEHLEHFTSSRREKVKQYDTRRHRLELLRGKIPVEPHVEETKSRYYKTMLDGAATGAWK